jgi:hypothetical protein
MRRDTGNPDVALIAKTNTSAFARFLDDLAAATGGKAIDIEDGAPLRPVFLDVLARFRARYQLTYTASGVETPGWHTVRVGVTRRGARVEARERYWKPGRAVTKQ